jgi:hypothetical protein
VPDTWDELARSEYGKPDEPISARASDLTKIGAPIAGARWVGLRRTRRADVCGSWRTIVPSQAVAGPVLVGICEARADGCSMARSRRR